MTPHELVFDITERFGPRPTTSASERHAADWFAQRCNQYGLNVEMQEFDTPRSPGYALGLLYILPTILIITSRFTREMAWVTWLLIALLLGCIVLLALQLQGRGILNAVLPKGPSQNVIARCNASSTGDRQRKVVFVSHLDTPLVSPLNTESTARLHQRLTGFSFWYLIAALLVMIFLSFDFQWMEFVAFDKTIDSQLWLWMLFAVLSAVPAILGLDALLMPLLRRQSPGANDSASGIAVLLSAIDAIALQKGGQLESHDPPASQTTSFSEVEPFQQASDFEQPGMADWLELDNSFDARKAGSAIGSWENFDQDKEATIAFETTRAPLKEPQPAYVPQVPTGGQTGLEGFSSILDGKEVWFVATGARHSDAAGMRALLSTYDHELRDALIVNLESVGFGALHWFSREAAPLTVRISSRVMSLSKRAARELELRIAPYKGVAGVTDATPALFHHRKAGTITRLVGNGFPEAYRATDDYADATDALVLEETVQFILEFLAQA